MSAVWFYLKYKGVRRVELDCLSMGFDGHGIGVEAG
jgi:hypothetical protein